MRSPLLSQIKNDLQASLPPGAFEIWIESLVELAQEGEILVLGCPNRFSLNWISQHYDREIRSALDHLAGSVSSYKLVVAPPARRPAVPEEEAGAQAQLDLPIAPGRMLEPDQAFNPDFTFETFVTGPSNAFAHQAAQALALGRGMPIRSLYLQAETGLGKSHLSQAVGLSLLGGATRARVLYLTAEEFTNQMISDLRAGRADSFKNRFRRCCDTLILEEVQFLSGKEKTQAELGFTLDSLLGDGKRVLFSGSRLPQEIPGLKPELASRLTAGVVATIGQPGFETRVKIVKAKALRLGLTLPDQAAESLAGAVTRDVRRLESALTNLLARSRLMDRPLCPDLIQEVLGVSGENPRPGLERIMDLVCRAYKVRPEELATSSRLKRITVPRSIVFYLGRRFTDLSLSQLGRALGRKHTTVLYALDRVERAVQKQDSLGRQVRLLAEKLGQG